MNFKIKPMHQRVRSNAQVPTPHNENITDQMEEGKCLN